MNKKRDLINLGFPSTLTIFFAILLVTFSTLTLYTADTDKKASQASADSTTLFYQADTTAKKILAEIDQILQTHYSSTVDSDSYLASIFQESWNKASLAPYQKQNCISCISVDYDNPNSLTLSYQVPISDSETLGIELAISYPTSDTDHFYRIKSWSTNNTEINPIQKGADENSSEE